MRWESSQFTGDVRAVGARGIYTISPAPAWKYRLTGRGHDQMPLSSLPLDGELFYRSGEARVYAAQIDLLHAEAQVSGC